jgi:hypothetical protein
MDFAAPFAQPDRRWAEVQPRSEPGQYAGFRRPRVETRRGSHGAAVIATGSGMAVGGGETRQLAAVVIVVTDGAAAVAERLGMPPLEYSVRYNSGRWAGRLIAYFVVVTTLARVEPFRTFSRYLPDRLCL